MIVTRSNFAQVIDLIRPLKERSLDTETTGLRPYHGDKLFSIIIGCTPTHDLGGIPRRLPLTDVGFYFNFCSYPGLDSDYVLTPDYFALLQAALLDDTSVKWFKHNAKFDMAMLANDQMDTKGEIFCCLALGRVEYNEHNEYDLDSSLQRIGSSKTFDLKQYCVEHGLFETITIPGKKQRDKRLFANKVPYEIITKYGEGDGTGTLALGRYLESSIAKQTKETPEGLPTLQDVRRSEVRLTRTVYRLEKVGVRIDKEYCVRASQYEADRAQKAGERFKKETGREYAASPKLFAAIFESERDKWEYTDKGNPSFDGEVLRKFESPAAKCILELREAKSNADFYSGFLYHADKNGDIHTNFNSHGARHGRFSSSNPNLQNLAAGEESEESHEEFSVRKAIIPRPGFVFFLPDYDQMEYRFMLELAAQVMGYETPLIKLVKTGLDVHTATAKLACDTGATIGRFEAKHANFCAIYGGGDQKLADTINQLSGGKAKCTRNQASAIKQAIFRGAPEIEKLVSMATQVAEKRGFVRNWLGRRSHFPNRRFAYRATNYLVAGGCADVVKVAMNSIDEFLLDKKSRMVLSIHDELPCEIHESEFHLAPKIKEIMEQVYKSTYLDLTCSAEWSDKSLGDKKKGFPV